MKEPTPSYPSGGNFMSGKLPLVLSETKEDWAQWVEENDTAAPTSSLSLLAGELNGLDSYQILEWNI